MTEFWLEWQHEVINGLYPLGRLLDGSEHSAVFVTECAAPDVRTAAVKIVPAERVTLTQLSHWRTAADLSHPHLIRLLDAGLCQLGGRQFLFVVMEYAEQTLAQILLQRALTEHEVQEMLPAVLDGLAFLHQQNLVQGQLKPANVLVVNDQLKLASDTVRTAGESRVSLAEPSAYDPPEAQSATISPAADIWALGITMVEALTQRPPAAPDKQSAVTGLPAPLAPALMDTIQRCLSHDPASRPTAIDLQVLFKRPPRAVEPSLPQTVADEVSSRAPAPPESVDSRVFVPIIVTILILVGAGWLGMRLFHSPAKPPQPAAITLQPTPRQSTGAPLVASQVPAAPVPARPEVSAPVASVRSRQSKPALPPVSPRPDQPAQPSADASASVIHEQIPSVPRSALQTIHGHVKVSVLVIVDPSGSVVDALVENAGPSPYFARLAREAARNWKFAPADTQDSREWLLRFEFTRGRATAQAVPRHS
jgi:TonB family protein